MDDKPIPRDGWRSEINSMTAIAFNAGVIFGGVLILAVIVVSRWLDTLSR